MPWGKHKGVAVHHLDDGYLSWLIDALSVTTLTKDAVINTPNHDWEWLRQSVMAELRFRGLRADRTESFVEEQEKEETGGMYPLGRRRAVTLE